MIVRLVSRKFIQIYKKNAPQGFSKRYINRILGEIGLLFLSDRESEELSLYCYRNSLWQDPASQPVSFFKWEKKLIEKHFPRSPAKILILASGYGREALELQKIGYSVYVTDFNPDAINASVGLLDESKLLGSLKASYLDIVEGEKNLPDIDFDGVILGWGSLTHMASEKSMCRFFSILHKKYRSVPILISWMPISSNLKIINFYRTVKAKLFSRFGIVGTFDFQFGPLNVIKYQYVELMLRKLGYKIIDTDTSVDYGNILVISADEG